MEPETQIQTKLNIVIDSFFGNADRNVSVQRNQDGSFRVNITSPSAEFLGSIIGQGGETIKAIKHLFHIWGKCANISLKIWVESIPVKNYD